MKHALRIMVVVGAIWVMSMGLGARPAGVLWSLSPSVALPDSCSANCLWGSCQITCDPPHCAVCYCNWLGNPSCSCGNCPPPAGPGEGAAFEVPCDRATLPEFVSFISYLSGVQIETEFPVPSLKFGVNTGGRSVGLPWTFQVIANVTGGWVKVGAALPADYSPPPQIVSWLTDGKPYIYRDRREALLALLKGDTIRPSPKAQKTKEENDIAAEIITAFQSGSPQISLAGVCTDHRTIGEVLQAVSYTLGFEVRLDDTFSEDFKRLHAFSPWCGDTSIPALLKFYASAFNAPIRVGGAVPVASPEALAPWIQEAAGGRPYRYKDRTELVKDLGGETISPDPRWGSLLSHDLQMLLKDIKGETGIGKLARVGNPGPVKRGLFF